MPLTMQMVIIILICIWVMPFFTWGIIQFFTLIASFLKVRKGQVKVWKTLPNDQVIEFWAQPSGGKITIKSANPASVSGKTTLGVNLTKGWIWRKGFIPFIKLDKDDNQVKWSINEISEGSVPKEVIDEMTDTSFAAGMMVGFRGNKEMKAMKMLLMILLVLMVVGIIFNYYFWSHTHIITQTVQVMGNVTSKVV